MADKYFTGAGTNTNWNSSPVTNWANATYNGSNGNQTAPAAGDRVFFDANSGTGAAVWNVSISLTGLDCTGSRNAISHSNGITITISAGDLIFPDGVGATYSPGTGTYTLTATTGTSHIKGNGARLNTITFNGTGGTFQLTGDLMVDNATATSNVTLTAGTFDTQGFTLTTPAFNSTGAGTRAIVGSGAWSITGTVTTPWNVSSSLTATSFTATVTFGGTYTATRTLAFAGKTYSCPIVINGNTGGFPSSITGNNTFPSLVVNGPNSLNWANAATQTFTGAVTASGTEANPISILCTTIGGATGAALVAGSASTFNWCAFKDIKASGAGTFTATNSLDLGGNTGFASITAPPIGVSRSRLHTGA